MPRRLISIVCLIHFALSAIAQEFKVDAPDGDFADLFGHSVDIDGDYAVVGAPLNERFWTEGGAAYVFRRIGGVWTYQKKLVPPNRGASGDHFGYSVAISGNTIIVGSPFVDIADNSDQGQVYVYSGTGTSWGLSAVLFALDGEQGDHFGKAVAIDGQRVLVGAPGQAEAAGAVYVFEKHYYYWEFEDKLVGSDTKSGDVFGAAVALEHNRIAVGAPTNIGVPGMISGAVYIYEPIYDEWTETHRLTNSDAGWYDNFGFSVDINGDRLIVGAPFRNDKRGMAYLFMAEANSWIEIQGFTAPMPEVNSKFGNAVEISDEYAVVGSYLEDNGGGDLGAAYLYENTMDSLGFSLKFTPSDGRAGDHFGFDVAVSDSFAMVGSPRHRVEKFADGAAYFFGPDLSPAPCATTLILDGEITSGTYMASQLITISGQIPSGQTVLLNCTSEMAILPDFQIQMGSALEMFMQGCN